MNEVAGEFIEFFDELLYGTGSWIGITLMLAIFLAMLVKWKYSGVLFLPITILMGIDYLNQDLDWQAIIMFLSSIFILLYLIKDLKR